MRTRVKICGITNILDANSAISAGADALGFVMYPKSPRFISRDLVKELVRNIPSFVTTVGLFVNETVENIEKLSDCFDVLQFHGDEDDEFCAQFGKKFFKAIRFAPGMDLVEEVARFPSSQTILLDAYVVDNYGGTGEQIDWQAIPTISQNIILAGGLHSKNVPEAIEIVRPYAVDVSTGVEVAKGQKDKQKIHDFFSAVATVDDSIYRSS